MTQIAQSAFSRVFLLEGRAAPNRKPIFESCMKSGGVSQGFGDVTKIECPDPSSYGNFIEVARVQGAKERATTTLTGRYAADVASDLLRLARQRCSSDVQIHFGKCTDPSAFNVFTKAIVLEDAVLINYSTDDLGALGSDENAAVGEMADISAEEIYEVTDLEFAERAEDIVVNPMVDVVVCSVPSCEECEDPDTGCDNIYAIAGSTGGSPGTPPDVVFSEDAGANWDVDDVNTLGVSATGDAIACIGDYVAVVSHSADAIEYKEKSAMGSVGGWTEITTGIVAAGSPTDAWSVGQYMFVVGDGGYVYGTDDVTQGVVVLDAGVATVQNLSAVHALDAFTAVAVGAAGAVIHTNTGDLWAAAPSSPVVGTLNCVWMRSKTEWWVGTAAGTLYYTVDSGVTWTQKVLPGAPYTAILDICFGTDSVGYCAGVTAAPLGKIMRTYDGGYSWVVLPESIGSMPDNDQITALAACIHDANFVVGVGLAGNGADGIIVVGQD